MYLCPHVVLVDGVGNEDGEDTCSWPSWPRFSSVADVRTTPNVSKTGTSGHYIYRDYVSAENGQGEDSAENGHQVRRECREWTQGVEKE